MRVPRFYDEMTFNLGQSERRECVPDLRLDRRRNPAALGRRRVGHGDDGGGGGAGERRAARGGGRGRGKWDLDW